MHTEGFGTALILRNRRVTLLNTPALEAERGRGQDLVQPGQLGSHDVIQVKDLPSLACHNEQLPLRNHEHAASELGEVEDIHFHPLEPRFFRLSLTKQW